MNRLTRRLREHAPVTAWARRLGVNRVTLQNILAGKSEVKNGMAAKRLVLLVESLHRGEWKWVVMGDPRLSRNYQWQGQAPFEKDARPLLAISLSAEGASLAFGPRG